MDNPSPHPLDTIIVQLVITRGDLGKTLVANMSLHDLRFKLVERSLAYMTDIPPHLLQFADALEKFHEK